MRALLLAGCAGGSRLSSARARHAGRRGRSRRRGARARPNDAAPKGPVVAALWRSAARCARAAGARRQPTLRCRNGAARAGARRRSRRHRRPVSAGRAIARAARAKISANRPLTNYASPNFSTVQNDFIARPRGQLRGRLVGPRAAHGRRRARSAEQSAADLENMRLAAHRRPRDRLLQPARDRHRARRARALDRSCSAARSNSRRARHDLGAASGLDVAQQQALLDSTLTQVDVLRSSAGSSSTPSRR